MITVEQFIKPCGCRSAGECNHNTGVDMAAIDALVDAFAHAMKKKLYRKMMEGKSGWDDPTWPMDSIRYALIDHVYKGDPVDVAAFAAFWWNREQ